MRKIKVTLAGQDYEVQELPTRANAAWREKLGQPFTAAVVVELLRDYAPQLAPALDSPDLYESELIAAFAEVLELGDPFSHPRSPGATPPATSPN